MAETALQVIETSPTHLVNISETALSIEEISKQAQIIKSVMQKVMVKGVHYGTIPGCGPKPALLKPGAESLLTTFRISTEVIAEDLSTPDMIRYRIMCKLNHIPTGLFLGSGVGECCSKEKKYVTQNMYTIANTILKMAKKRALVDAVLTVTGASSLFTQDIEDLAENDAKPENKNKQQTIIRGKLSSETDSDLIALYKELWAEHLGNALDIEDQLLFLKECLEMPNIKSISEIPAQKLRFMIIRIHDVPEKAKRKWDEIKTALNSKDNKKIEDVKEEVVQGEVVNNRTLHEQAIYAQSPLGHEKQAKETLQAESAEQTEQAEGESPDDIDKRLFGDDKNSTNKSAVGV